MSNRDRLIQTALKLAQEIAERPAPWGSDAERELVEAALNYENPEKHNALAA